MQRRYPEARSLLDDLLAIVQLPVWQRRKLYDLNLQWYSRRADQLRSEYDPKGSLTMLQELRSAYEACPPELCDDMMRTRLHRAEPTARASLARLENQDDRAIAAGLVTWLSDQGRNEATPVDAIAVTKEPTQLLGERVGDIKTVLRDKRFGFVRSEGEDFFFHFVTTFVDAHAGTGWRPDSGLLLSIREGPKGPRATADAILMGASRASEGSRQPTLPDRSSRVYELAHELGPHKQGRDRSLLSDGDRRFEPFLPYRGRSS